MTVDSKEYPKSGGQSGTGKPGSPRKPYTPPKMVTEDLFESKGLACLKVATGGPEDCSLLFPGSSTTS
jgi:hypothetical protein